MAVIYNYGDHGIYLVNQTGKDFGQVRTAITVYDSNSQKILAETVTNTGVAYGSQKIFDLSHVAVDSPVYFLDLKSNGSSGPEGDANNFYWLSTKPDVLDEAKSTWFVTPNKSFANFTALNRLPQAEVQAHVEFWNHKSGMDSYDETAEVTLTNTTDTLAFFIEMKIVGKKSQRLLTPVFWDDNYISLPPHAGKTFHARFLPGERPELKLQGWNVNFENVLTGR